jgi:hypothetical protein
LEETILVKNMQSSSLNDALTFGTFMLMGAGANWVAVSAIAQETSIFIEESPQGLCVGSFLTISNNAGFLGVLLYFAIFRRVRPIPHVVAMPVIFFMGMTSLFLAAFAFNQVVDNVSLFLYLANFLAGAVGAVGSVIQPQFLAYYKDHLITAGRAGGNAGILISAIVAIAQSPGGLERFPARTYLLVFACLLMIPIFPFYAITKYRIGERGKPLYDNSRDGSGINSNYLLENQGNSSFVGHVKDNNRSSTLDIEKEEESSDLRQGSGSASVLMEQIRPSLPMVSNTMPLLGRASQPVYHEDPSSVVLTEVIAERLIKLVLPSIDAEELLWMKKTLPYALAVGFADFCAFGILTSAAPFAYSKTSENGGFLNLTISIQAGSCVLVFGDLLTTYCHIPLRFIVPTMFGCTLVFVLAAFGVISPPPYLLIVFAAMINFMEAHTLTSTYRTIATKFPGQVNQKAARLVGFTDGLLNTSGAVLGVTVVASVASC